MLSDEELLRYSRQIMLPELDIAGQEALRNANVLIAGVGGLGSPVALYLAAAGVGQLILADHDRVDLSNLQRQIAHGTGDIDRPKAQSAAESIAELNPHCRTVVWDQKITPANVNELVSDVSVIVDCSDNFALRFLLNRVSVAQSIPLISGAAIRMDGQISVYDPRDPESPCYHCLFEETGEEDQTCTANGVLAPVVGMLGSMQAIETIKMITAVGSPLVGRLLIVDALSMKIRDVKIKPNPSCKVCG